MSAGLVGTILGACGSDESTGPRPVASVQVTAPTSALTVGKTLQLGATLQDAAGKTLTGQPVMWETSDPVVATVDAFGVVTATSVGAVTITARAGGVSGSLALSTNLDIEPGGTWKKLIAGGASPCALTPAGAVYCWGSNYYSRLGRGGGGDTLAHPVPAAVVGGLRFESIAGNGFHACALATGGAAYCWGSNEVGQLGADPTSVSESSVPVAVVGGRTFRTIATGSAHSCAIASDGAAFCWGANYDGRLGDGLTGDSYMPVAVAGGLTFTAIAAGRRQSCGIADGGDMYCWGSNYFGGLGGGTTTGPEDCSSGTPCSTRPVRVIGGHRFTAVASYAETTCGLTVERDIYCWGLNHYGELGTGEATGPGAHPTPTRVVGDHKFLAIARNTVHTCALSTAGEIYCWGDDEYGALGVDPATLPTCSDGDVSSFPCSTTPVRLPGNMVFSSVAAGNYSTCGINTAGTAYCWGKNTWGQLGDGTTNSSVTPVEVLTP